MQLLSIHFGFRFFFRILWPNLFVLFRVMCSSLELPYLLKKAFDLSYTVSFESDHAKVVESFPLKIDIFRIVINSSSTTYFLAYVLICFACFLLFLVYVDAHSVRWLSIRIIFTKLIFNKVTIFCFWVACYNKYRWSVVTISIFPKTNPRHDKNLIAFFLKKHQIFK